jgi:DNA polymerase-3 subunit alpha
LSLKFVSLHNHDGQSLYDAIGAPEDYADWMLKNAGEDSSALAITNHGNMNSIGSIVVAQEKYKKAGKPVKFIYGVEAYYIPSLVDWTAERQKVEEAKKEKKEKPVDEDSDLVIENEKESKSKFYDPINRRHHLVLLASNQIGLKNLFRLVSRSYREGFYRKPRIDFDMLADHHEGIIASTACVAGLPAWCCLHPEAATKGVMTMLHKELDGLMSMFGKDNFFLELQFNKLAEQKVTNEALIQFSAETGYDLIATCDSHYMSPDMWKDREIYKMLGYQMLKKATDLSSIPSSFEDLEVELYLKNGDQMFETYLKTMGGQDQVIKEAIERTYKIAHEQIESVTPDKTIKLPKSFHVTDTVKTPFDKLKGLVLDGLKKKKLNKQEYIDRAAYELGIIANLKVEEYFLTMKEILDVLRRHMLIGPGRGSGAGSLVCYLLNITMIDPIRHGLLFERFLSPSRAEMPDVDSDVELKDQALEILKEHFGSDSVLAISNYNRLQLKSLIKDLSSLHGIPFQEVNDVTKIIESEARPAIMEEIGGDQKLYELTFEKAQQYSPTFQDFLKKHPDVGTHVENLYKEVKSVGRHAGGVLVVPDAQSCLPIVRIRGIDQCPIMEGITAQHCKYFGLVKFDILGLTTLKIIRRCIEEILKEKKISPTIDEVWKFYNETIHPDIISYDDPKVFKNVYQLGRFPSIFQFAERGVQQFCRKAKPNNVGDISAITALWRPGPLKGSANENYLAVQDWEIKKEHKIIQEVLGDTKGLLLYQEQFMLLANKLAGFSLEEADKLRKLLVKPATTLSEEMKKDRIVVGQKFIDGCIANGLSKERADRLWNREIMGFISYGFNKSHSVAYAYDSYQCAWLYTYYPKHWIKACLECDPDLEKTINVVRTLGLNVTKPDINYSCATEWNIQPDNSCVPPFTSLKGIGTTAAYELLHHRPREGFKDIKDFFFRDDIWRWSKLNKKTLEILIRMEAFDSLKCVGPNALFKSYKHMEASLFEVEKKFEKIKKGSPTLEELATQAPTEDWATAEKMSIQKGIVGFYDKGLIIGKFLDSFDEFQISAIDELPDERPKKKVWGVVEKLVQRVAKNGRPFIMATASGLTEKQYVFKIWDAEIANNDIWQEGSVVVFGLDYSEQYGYSLSRYTKVLKVTQ